MLQHISFLVDAIPDVHRILIATPVIRVALIQYVIRGVPVTRKWDVIRVLHAILMLRVIRVLPVIQMRAVIRVLPVIQMLYVILIIQVIVTRMYRALLMTLTMTEDQVVF